MDEHNICRILTINSGSSSLKFSLYHIDSSEELFLRGSLDRIGLQGSRFRILNAAGEAMTDEQLDVPDHDAASKTLLDWLQARFPNEALDAVGHRVVHGGTKYSQPCLITAEVFAGLKEIVRLAPEHLPHELKAIEAVQRHFPALRQAACFDTAFHRQMPEVAQRYPMPRSLWHEGVIRYGFHGLSYEYIVKKLREVAGAEAAAGRVIIAHLGNGASMAAVRAGRGVDTTMGFTPAGGMMMGTRSGDLDPGVLLYLLQEKNRSPATVDYLVNQRSGLIGVSGSSSDMLDLLQREQSDLPAAEALALYCYLAKKQLGALATVLSGLDTLVFTAGVGANSPVIRRRICEGLQFLGIHLDADRNQSNAAVISSDGSPVTVRVMQTDEELMIARHTFNLLHGGE
jgi:acetate kinase